MEKLQENRMLQHQPDTLEAVRRDVNLDKRRIDESVDLLHDWLQKQTHFIKKDFSRDYLERTLVTSKGSMERTKQILDNVCTYRTLMPEFFVIDDLKKEFETCKDKIQVALLPKITTNHHRIILVKIFKDTVSFHVQFMIYKYAILLAEYLKRYEYVKGFQLVVDVEDSNIMKLISSANIVDLRKLVMICTQGYGMRLKAIHLVTPTRWVDTLLGIAKQVLSTKIFSRVKVQKSFSDLFEYLPKEIFPVEYGGEEMPLLMLSEKWIELLSSEDNKNYFRHMNTARTNESCRPEDHFSEHYSGTPGSFRALSVD